MTHAEIVARVQAQCPSMTEQMVNDSLENLLRLGLILPQNLPLTREAEAMLMEELGKNHPAQVQRMIDRMVEAGILLREP